MSRHSNVVFFLSRILLTTTTTTTSTTMMAITTSVRTTTTMMSTATMMTGSSQVSSPKCFNPIIFFGGVNRFSIKNSLSPVSDFLLSLLHVLRFQLWWFQICSSATACLLNFLSKVNHEMHYSVVHQFRNRTWVAASWLIQVTSEPSLRTFTSGAIAQSVESPSKVPVCCNSTD